MPAFAISPFCHVANLKLPRQQLSYIYPHLKLTIHTLSLSPMSHCHSYSGPPSIQRQWGVDEAGPRGDRFPSAFLMLTLISRYEGIRTYYCFAIPDKRVSLVEDFIKHAVSEEHVNVDESRSLICCDIEYLSRSTMEILAAKHRKDRAAGSNSIELEELTKDQLLNMYGVLKCVECKSSKSLYRAVPFLKYTLKNDTAKNGNDG